MSSVEASTAADRHEFGLLPQDEFIRDRLTEDDYVVMSVGGNDVALAPTVATAVNLALLVFSPHWLIAIGLAPGYHHLLGWFYEVLFSYARKLCAKVRPKKLIVNFIYFPDESPPGWADATLALLLYPTYPTAFPLGFPSLLLLYQLSSLPPGPRQDGLDT